jgi:inorganic triphosphatase YgiF
MAATIEVELKLSADEAALRSLAAAEGMGPARLGPTRQVEELDIYLDTPDLRLAAARWACRLRTRDGRRTVSLKGPAEHLPGEALHRRPEVEGPGPGPGDETADPLRWPPSPARDLGLRLSGGAPLEERLALRQRRTERDVLVDGRRVALLSLDRVSVERRGARLGELRVVEVEVVGEAAPGAWLRQVADALAARPGLRPEPMSKLERALELAEGDIGEAK